MFAEVQRRICGKFLSDYLPPDPMTKVGIARNVREGLNPLNGLRIRPEGGTNGWYIWAGQVFSQAPDFFVPLHAEHLPDWCPDVMPYLALAPGWRFLIAPNYEDVWFDSNLLKT